MEIESLHIYPVKGLRGVELQSSMLESRGLAHDRRWMLVDAGGKFMSQREHPALARLTPALIPGGLRVSDDSGTITIAEPAPDAERLPVTLWGQALEGYAAAPDADAWFSRFLAQPCRLVFQGGLPRQVSRQYAPGNTHASYADGYPLLLTTSTSLEDLNRRTGKPLSMKRFRPSIVIAGASAWAEDGWKTLRIDDIVIEIVKPCLRCVVTTTDQRTGARDGAEPLATLETFRRLRQPGLNGVAFGQNAIPLATGVVSVGDRVTVTKVC